MKLRFFVCDQLSPYVMKNGIHIFLFMFSVFAPLLGKREKNYSYLDYYSEFYVNENGFITCHVISKVAPTNSGAEISRSKRMAAGAMATLFGLSGSGSDQMTSPIPAVGFKSLPDSLNSSIVEKH